MKRLSKILLSICSTIVLAGCGHTMYHKVEGTGLYGRIPTPNGGSLVEVAIGDMSITSGILRGGATLDENTSKGGTFGSVSVAKHTHISTVPAMNEGNIRDVLSSPNTDDKTKQLVAQYLITRTQSPPPAAAVTSVNSGSATGSKDAIPDVKPTKTGLDNVVDKAAEVVPPVVDSVSTNTAKVVKDVSNNIENGVVKTSGSFFDKIKSIGIWLIISLALIILVGEILYFYSKRQKEKVNEKLLKNNNNENIQENIENKVNNNELNLKENENEQI